jgi:1-acyl-sn-glycerol-3-phosphate acyltransferase
MKFRILRSIIRFIMKIISDIEVQGLENISPEHVNLLVASNHLGRLDTAALLCVVDREDIIMAIAEKYKNHLLFGAIGRAINVLRQTLRPCVRF